MLIFDPPGESPVAQAHSNLMTRQGNHSSRFREHRFVFDRLFDQNTSQDEVFNSTTRPLLDSVLDGYNATVFAYGATGCGKTHTISGTPTDPGIIFLTMQDLFERIEQLKDTKSIDLTLSYLEIYNETIRDLLCPAIPSSSSIKKQQPLLLREDAEKRITVSNLSSHRPDNVDQVMNMIVKGNMNRTMSPTEANAVSSRSHAVLQINVTQKPRTASLTEDHTFATLSIIDLAGSERAASTRNQGVRLIEGANINKSLLALGNCINALCDPRQRGHIPYRDSKLTRLLKFSLGGNCKTVMIVCVSPSSQHYDETLNTLKYADRAKMIKTKVSRNEHSLDRHVASYLKMIASLRSENAELREREKDVVSRALNVQTKQRNMFAHELEVAKSKILEWVQESESTIDQCIMGMSRYAILSNRISQLEILLPIFHPDASAYSSIDQLVHDMQQELSSLACYSQPEFIDNIFQSYGRLVNYWTEKLSTTPGWNSNDELAFEHFTQLNRSECVNKIVSSSQSRISSDTSVQNISRMMVQNFAQEGRPVASMLRNLAQEIIIELNGRKTVTSATTSPEHNSSMSIDFSPESVTKLEVSHSVNNSRASPGTNTNCITSRISAGLEASTIRSPSPLAVSKTRVSPYIQPQKLSSLARASLSAIPVSTTGTTTTITRAPSTPLARSKSVTRKTLSPIKRPTAIRRSPSKRKNAKRVRWPDEQASDIDAILDPQLVTYQDPDSSSDFSDSETELVDGQAYENPSKQAQPLISASSSPLRNLPVNEEIRTSPNVGIALTKRRLSSQNQTVR